MKKEQPKMTSAQQQATRERRQATFTTKRANAMTNLQAKVAAMGDDALLDEFEFAAYIGKSVQWLRNRRIYGGSLPFKKIGASVRYRLGDIKAAA